MATIVQRVLKCKPLVWALSGVFLMGFGAVGLTTCNDGSKRVAKMEALETEVSTQTASLAAVGATVMGATGASLDLTSPEALGTLNDEVAKLAETKKALEEEVNDLKGTAESMTEEVSFQSKRMEELQAELEDYRSRDVANDDRVMSMRTNIAALSEESEKAAELEAEVEDLNQQVTELTIERDSVISAAKDDKAFLDEIRAELAAAENTLGERNAELAEFKADSAQQAEEEVTATDDMMPSAELFSSAAQRTKLLETDREDTLESLTRSLTTARETRASMIQEIDALYGELDGARDQIRSLRNEVRSLNDERGELEYQSAELLNERNTLAATLSAGAAAISAEEAKIEELTAQLAAGEEALAESAEANTELEQALARAKSESDRLKADLAEATAAAEDSALADGLEAELAQAVSAKSSLMADFESAEANIDDLQGQLVASQEAHDALVIQIEELKTELDAAKENAGDAAALEAEIASLQQELADAEAVVVPMPASNDEADAQIDGLQIALVASQEKGDQLTTTIEQLRTQIDAMDEKAAADIDGLQIALVASQEKGDQLTKTIEQLRTQMDTMDEKAAALAASASEGKTAEAELAALRAAAAVAAGEMEALKGELAAAEAVGVAAAGKVDDMRALLSEQRDHNEELERQLAAATAAAEDAKAASEAAKQELAALMARVADMKAELEAARAETQSVADARDAALDAAKSTAQQLDTANGQIAELQGRIPPLQAQVSTLEGSLATIETDYSKLASQLTDAEERAVRFGTMLSEAPTRQQLDAYKDRLNETAQIADNLQTENIDLRNELDQLRPRLAAIFDTNGEIDDKNRDLERQINDLRSQLVALMAQNQSLSDQLDAASAAPVTSTVTSDALRNALLLGLGADAVENPDGTVAVSSNLTFSSGSATLSPVGQSVLANAAAELVRFLNDRPDVPGKIVVEGHTDAQPINTIRYPSNWELSASRAATVVNFLIQQGVPADRIAALAYADTQPIDPGTSREAFARNRRIQFDFSAD